MDNFTALEKFIINLRYELNTVLSALALLEKNSKTVEETLNLYEIKDIEFNLEEQQIINSLPPRIGKKASLVLLDLLQKKVRDINDIAISLGGVIHCSRQDREDVDLHERIEESLSILQEQLIGDGKVPKIEVLREYGNITNIQCYDQIIDRVFVPILKNAIDAIRKSVRGRTDDELEQNLYFIRIKTEMNHEKNTAVIKIADNGSAIDKAMQYRMFWPSFSYQDRDRSNREQDCELFVSRYIVEEKHGGKLTYDSTPGEGSEFTIEIPIQPVEP